MKSKILILLFLLALPSCNYPNGLPVLGNFKTADQFARTFIGELAGGQTDSCFAALDPFAAENDSSRVFIKKVAQNLNGLTAKKVTLAEETMSKSLSTSSNKTTQYTLAYEYQFGELRNALFRLIIVERNNRLYVSSVSGWALKMPLSELGEFTLRGKTIVAYFFFVLMWLVPIFTFGTIVLMLLSHIPKKKKVTWFFIIFILSFPRFMINWSTGHVDVNLLQFGLLPGGMGRANLYNPWLVFFHVPVGAISYYIWRRNKRNEETSIDPLIDETYGQETETGEESALLASEDESEPSQMEP